MMKMVIVVRTDLNMRKSEMISQGAHCAVNSILQNGIIIEHNGVNGLFVPHMPNLTDWLIGTDGLWESGLFDGKYTIVAVGVSSEIELVNLCRQAEAANINFKFATDLEKTEFRRVPTITSCVIGPADSTEINKITQHLKLI